MDQLPRGGWDGELVPVRVELCRTTNGLGCSYRGSGGVVFRGVGKAVGPVWVEAEDVEEVSFLLLGL